MLYVDCVFVCKDMFFFEMSPFFLFALRYFVYLCILKYE